MTPERFRRIRRTLDLRQPDLTVLLENVHKPHNFAAILRSADAVGLFEAHAVLADKTLRTSLVSASGADRWVEVHVHERSEAALDELASRGFNLLAANPGGDALDYREADFTRPSVVLLGQELDGLTPATIERADVTIEIPMNGLVTSLNVSVAAAVILYEAQRQRAAANLYESSRLPSGVHQARLFEWAYPDLADLCRRKGVPYPELSEDGEILGQLPR